MAARMIDGKAVAAAVRERVKVDVAAYKDGGGAGAGAGDGAGRRGPASEIYVRNKRRTTEEVGMRSIHHGLEAGDPARRSCSSWSAGSARTTRSTASSSSCRCPPTSIPTRSCRDRTRRRTSTG